MRFLFTLSGLLLLTLGLANAKTVTVADGDVFGLIRAVGLPDDTPAGQLSPGLKVVLARNGRYEFPANSPALRPRQSVTISGRGATLTVNGLRRTTLVSPGRSMSFFDIRVEHIRSQADVLFRGALTGATFDDIDLSLGKGAGQVSLFSGSGSFVTVSNIHLSGRSNATKAVFTGRTVLGHATITGVTGDVGSRVFANIPDMDGNVGIAASVLAGNAVPLCVIPLRSGGESVSGGGNVFDDDSCGFDTAGDRLVVDAGLLPLNTTLGRLPVHPLSLASPALDSGELCGSVYQFVVTRPFDGNGDGIIGCDAGAFEMPAIAPSQGRANGLFFQRGNDGHFLSLQRIQFNQYLIQWFSFDGNGDPVVILAVGKRLGKRISGDAFISSGGHLVPGSGPIGQQVEDWGHLTVTLRSCQTAVLTYQSGLPGFGSGQFVIDRLAFAKDISCEDAP